MGTAILPAQDCLVSYKANQNRASNARPFHQANLLQPAQEVAHTKRNLRGRIPEYERRGADPQPVPRSPDFERRRWSSQSGLAFAASQAVSSGNLSNGIWYSQSFRTSEKIFRPQSTPPVLDAQGAPHSGSLSVFYAQQSCVQQSVSSRQYFEDAKYSMGNPVPNHEARGKKLSHQSKHILMEEVTILKRGETYKAKESDRKYQESDRKNQARERPSNGRVSANITDSHPSYQKKNKVIWASKSAASGSGDEFKANQSVKPINPKQKFDSLVITSTEPLGPDPSVLPKEGSGIVQSVSAGIKAAETTMGNNGSQAQLKDSVSFVGGDSFQVGSPPTRGDNAKSFNSPVFDMENWAGPAYSNSPPPSSLPVPKFSMQQMRSISGDLIEASESFNRVGQAVKEASGSLTHEKVEVVPIAMGKPQSFTALDRTHHNNIQVGFDVSATQDLRRLLRLD